MLLALVSERTGRPAEALTAELDLTADLRLDSLARVELLAALRTRIPDLPEITVAELLDFRTLGELQAAVEGRPPRTADLRGSTEWQDSTIRAFDLPRGPDGRHELIECHSPIAWLIEWFAAASGATTLRDVSLLRDPSTGTGPITVRRHGKRLALVSNVTHGRARIVDTNPPAPEPGAPAVTVRGARLLGWPLDHSRTDPAATDECLRLAAIWAHEEFGGTAVVTSVREVRVHRTGLLEGPGKAVRSAGRVRDGVAECDVLLMDADGSARLELLGVRLRRHPR